MLNRLTSLARYLAIAATLTLALSWALVALTTPAAHAAGLARHDSGTTGTISGVLTDGTTSAPLANQPVTLQLNVSSSVKNLATVKTGANGAFTFANVDAGPAALGGEWAVYTTYQGGTYASAALTVSAGKTVDGSFQAYDATQDSSNLKVTGATVLISSVDSTHGLVDVGEILTFSNSGKTAFVGQAPSDNSAAMPPLLRFAVPSSAINLSEGAGFYGTQVFQIDTGFAATATVPPGTSEFAFSYQVPYTGTTLDLPFKAEYPVEQVEALAPPSMLARDANGFTAQGIVTSFGAQYQVYTATNLATSKQVTLNLYALPRAGEQPDFSAAALVWLAAILAVILALLAGFYVWRGAFLSAPAAVVAVGAAGAVEADHKQTLQQTLDLERRHARGEISDTEFKRQGALLRQRLRAQLAARTPPERQRQSEARATEAPVTSASTPAAEPKTAEAVKAPASASQARAGKGGGQ